MAKLIKHSKWEGIQKENFQKASNPFQNAVEQGNGKGYEFNGFSQDLFSSLYQPAPKYPEQVSEGQTWQKSALDSLQELREFKDLRNCGTLGDSFQAGLGSQILTEQFAKNLPVMDQPNPDTLQNEIEALQDFAQDNPGTQAGQDAQARAQALQAQLEPSKQAWENATLDQDKVRQIARKALQTAKQEIGEAEEGLRAFGFGNGPGEDGYSNPNVKLELAKRIKDKEKLKEIARLAGRFRREARAIASKKKNAGPDELTDIEVGGDISRAIPAELCKLAHPVRKLEFFKNFVEKSLVQYKLEEVEKKARGPIVVCIDNSSSMYGQREVWSKAVSLALCQLAVDSKRDFVVVHFNTTVARVDSFQANKVDPATLVDSMAYFAGGGTTFFAPLERAFELIQTAKNVKDADVVFITDGDGYLSPEQTAQIKSAKVKTGAKVFSIVIGGSADTLKAISDYQTDLADLNDCESVKEKLFSI